MKRKTDQSNIEKGEKENRLLAWDEQVEKVREREKKDNS